MDDYDSVQNFYKRIPIITKILMTSTLLFGICISLNIITPYYLILNWKDVINKFSIWQLYTAFVYCGKLIY